MAVTTSCPLKPLHSSWILTWNRSSAINFVQPTTPHLNDFCTENREILRWMVCVCSAQNSSVGCFLQFYIFANIVQSSIFGRCSTVIYMHIIFDSFTLKKVSGAFSVVCFYRKDAFIIRFSRAVNCVSKIRALVFIYIRYLHDRIKGFSSLLRSIYSWYTNTLTHTQANSKLAPLAQHSISFTHSLTFHSNIQKLNYTE